VHSHQQVRHAQDPDAGDEHEKGAGLLLVAVAVHVGTTTVTIRAVATILFLLFTAPVAAHVIGRAAYLSGWLQLWKHTLVDELREADEKAEQPET